MHRLYQVVIDKTLFYLAVEYGALTFGLGRPDLGCPRVRFYYPSVALAFAILEGKANPMEAFMARDVRSDGRLIWRFSWGFFSQNTQLISLSALGNQVGSKSLCAAPLRFV